MPISDTEAIFVREWRAMLAERRQRIRTRLAALVLLAGAALLAGPFAGNADAVAPIVAATCLC